MRERVKTILLAALMLLTVYLTLRVWIYDPALLDSPSVAWAAVLRPLLGFGTPEPSRDAEPALELVSPCAWPSVISVNSGGVRLGAWYGVRETDALAIPSRDLLREALGTAGEPSAVTREKWFEALRGDCVYMEYDVALPLGVLAAWVSGSCPISASVRVLAICAGDGGVELWYREEPSGRYFRAETGASPVMPDISASGAKPCRFAFERPDAAPGAPDTMLVMEETPSPPVVKASGADATLFCGPFLKELQIAENNWYEEENGRVYVDNLRTCRVSASGRITYRNPEAREDGARAAGDMASELEKARRLLASLSRALGDARWALSGVDGGIYSFTAQADGIPVPGGAYAKITFSSGEIVEADIMLRQYTLTGELSVLLPVKQAQALLPKSAAGLGLCYPDAGDELIAAQWRADK